MKTEELEIVERGENFLLLGVHDRDEHRILVRPTTDEEEDAAEEGTTQRIYPCRTCWWERACGPDGQECHS